MWYQRPPFYKSTDSVDLGSGCVVKNSEYRKDRGEFEGHKGVYSIGSVNTKGAIAICGLPL